jgi:hypothetical protein
VRLIGNVLAVRLLLSLFVYACNTVLAFTWKHYTCQIAESACSILTASSDVSAERCQSLTPYKMDLNNISPT